MVGVGRQLKNRKNRTIENPNIWNNLHGTGTDRSILIISKLNKKVKIFDFFGDFAHHKASNENIFIFLVNIRPLRTRWRIFQKIQVKSFLIKIIVSPLGMALDLSFSACNTFLEPTLGFPIFRKIFFLKFRWRKLPIDGIFKLLAQIHICKLQRKGHYHRMW